MAEPRMTVQVQLILQALLQDPGRELYGLEIADLTGLLSGTAYPILLRLEQQGWVRSRWEDVDPKEAKRPPRRYYRLTDHGAARARVALKDVPRSAQQVLFRLGWAGAGGVL